MSGIAGIIRFDVAPASLDDVARITAALRSRGRDGIHHWAAGPVALGHCMLRTTPESLGETQPLISEDKQLVLVMDGRLDNREDLARAVRGRAPALRSNSDAELVLSAYRVWGADCPNHLLGDFAFAIWDDKKHELFCARDHFGAKPFYYFKGPRFLAFGSDEEAFFGLPEVAREPNEFCIAGILVPEFDGYDFDASNLKDVVKLPPGKTLTVRPSGQLALNTYWELEPQEESRFASDAECEEAFRDVFSEAVRCRFRTIGNPALMLSGGIDSASIAGAAHSLLDQLPGKALDTYSVISDDAATCAETQNIQAIIRGHEAQAHLYRMPSFRDGITDADLADAAWTHAHPVSNTILLPAMMYLSAARSGNNVMFDGVDGDLATYTRVRYIPRLLRQGAFRSAWHECREASRNNTYLKHLSPARILALSVWDLTATDGVRRVKNRIRHRLRGQSPYGSSLINPEFADSIDLDERLGEFLSDDGGHSLSDQEQHIRALTPVGIARGMEGFDRVAARYGLEAWHPWADKRVLEFYLRLPFKYKVRDGWTKHLVRSATAPWLDEPVRWHTGKDHLGGSLTYRLMAQSRNRIAELFRGEKPGPLDNYVDNDRLSALLCAHLTGADPWTYDPLYETATLASWLRRLDGTDRLATAPEFSSTVENTCTADTVKL